MPDNPKRPLISDRSPSYERAQAGSDERPVAGAQVVALLSRLWEAEDNAAGALEKAQIDGAVHRAHQAALGQLIVAHGGSPPRSDEARAILGHAADVERGGATLPRMLEQLRAELHQTYAKVLGSPHLDDSLRIALTALS